MVAYLKTLLLLLLLHEHRPGQGLPFSIQSRKERINELTEQTVVSLVGGLVDYLEFSNLSFYLTKI